MIQFPVKKNKPAKNRNLHNFDVGHLCDMQILHKFALKLLDLLARDSPKHARGFRPCSFRPGARSSKVPKLFGPEKPFVKLRPAYSLKLVSSYVIKGIKIKITARFRALRRLRFEDTKRIMSPEMREKFRYFRETGPRPQLFKGWIAQSTE